MALCLQQELNLSRRACWPRNSEIFRNSDNNNNDNDNKSNDSVTKINNDKKRDETCSHSFRTTTTTTATIKHKGDDNEFSSGAKNLTNGKSNTLTPSSSFICNSLRELSNFKWCTCCTLLSQLNGGGGLKGCRHLMFLVLLVGTLLSQCNLAAARPNLTSAGAIIATPLPSLSSAAAIVQSSDGLDTTVSSTHLEKSGHELAEGEPHTVTRYPVFTIDFMRVELPFIIGIWILFASIAKIGE